MTRTDQKSAKDRSATDASDAVSTLPGIFPLTDIGNAERLVARFRHRIRYCPQRRKWLVNDGKRWRWDETGEVVRLAKQTIRALYQEAANCPDDGMRGAIAKHARQSEGASRIQAMVTMAQTEPGVPVLLSELDCDPWLLNCENGTIDLRTGKLRPSNARDLITKSTGLPFDIRAKSALWERVLAEATGGNAEIAAYLQRVAGYALIGAPLERACFFVYGAPGTAKSTWVRALHAAFGDYGVSCSFETFCVQSVTGGNRGDLVRLAGARLVTCVEIRRGAKWDESLIKAVTGGDAIVASAKFESEVSFVPTFTLIFAANDSPGARDDDEGLWVRMRRVPFDATIPIERQDRTLKDRLAEPEHAAAILAWAVAGCLQYQKHGLSEPDAVKRSTADYRHEQDRFGEFLSDCIVFEYGATITRKQLRVMYEDWAKEVGAKHLLGAREIATRLRQRNCAERMVRGQREWVGARARAVSDPSGGEQSVEQGAPRSAFHREVPGEDSHVPPYGNDAPNCSRLLPGFEDDERRAIQAEAGE